MFTAVSRLLILPIRATRGKATYLHSAAHRVLVPCGTALLGVTCAGADFVFTDTRYYGQSG